MKKLLLTSVAMMALTACAVGPDFLRPAAPETTRLTETDLPEKTTAANSKAGAAQSFVQNKTIPADWWTLFKSEPLNALMAQALKGNPDLQAAKAALTQAREAYLSGRGALMPQVDARLGATRQRVSPAQFGTGGLFNLYNASVDVSYDLDIFGGTRRELEVLQAQVDFQKYEVEAAYLSLTANVATAAINEASLREQIKETKAIIGIMREQMNLLDKQFKFGAIAKTALLEQQALVAQTETTLPPLEKQLAQTRNALAILVGKMPGDGVEQTFELSTLHLPEEIPLSLPSELVNQRPDIRAAEEMLKAANAQVGIATANMLPRVTLSGGYGGSSTSTNSIFTPENLAWNIGAGLLQPLFHGGQLLHAKRGQEAALERADAQYRSTVLRAFQNVADSLRALQYDADALAAQVKAERAASESFNLYRSQYNAGAITYSQTLDVQRTLQETRVGVVRAQAARFADTIALFQAIGGGWWNRDTVPVQPVVEAPAAEAVAASVPSPVPAPAPVEAVAPAPAEPTQVMTAPASSPAAAEPKPLILLEPRK